MPNCISIVGPRGQGRITKCEHLAHCQQVEPLGTCLPCENVLPFEAAGDPAPSSKPRGKGKHIIVERIFDVWPAGQQTITIAQLAEAMGQHETTARHYLERAVSKGLVVKEGRRGRANLYQRV